MRAGATLTNKGNLLRIKRKVKKPTAKTRALARKKAERIFERAKKGLINSFRNHPVTKEIEAGPSSGNSSGTLGGYGNLSSFIGFAAGANPIQTVLAALQDGIEMEKRGQEKRAGKFVEFLFKIRLPSMSVLSALTPMPWESGRSWLYGIEKGISGFSSYMYSKTAGGDRGRSGSAIQSRNPIRGGGFRNIPYMSQILKGFKENLKKKR